MDWIVGNVVEALESNSIAENTLTLFTVRPARGSQAALALSLADRFRKALLYWPSQGRRVRLSDTPGIWQGDNGPWMIQGLSGGSEGLLTGRYAQYWNTGKGSTWEGARAGSRTLPCARLA